MTDLNSLNIFYLLSKYIISVIKYDRFLETLKYLAHKNLQIYKQLQNELQFLLQSPCIPNRRKIYFVKSNLEGRNCYLTLQ